MTKHRGQLPGRCVRIGIHDPSRLLCLGYVCLTSSAAFTVKHPTSTAKPSHGPLVFCAHVGQDFLQFANGQLWVCCHQQPSETGLILEVTDVYKQIDGTVFSRSVPFRG